MLLPLMPTKAQDVKELSLKVDSLQFELRKLQNDYVYLYCECKLNKIKASVENFKNDLETTFNKMAIDILSNNVKAYTISKMNYEENLKIYETYKMLYQKNIILTESKLKNSNPNEFELDILQNIAESIENTLNSIGEKLQYHKEMLDVYKRVL